MLADLLRALAITTRTTRIPRLLAPWTSPFLDRGPHAHNGSPAKPDKLEMRLCHDAMPIPFRARGQKF